MHTINQAIQNVGKVQFTIHQFVANTRPAGFFRGNDFDAVLLVDAQHRGHDNTGAIGQGNEANFDFFFFGLV